jgi:hypothetical protein
MQRLSQIKQRHERKWKQKVETRRQAFQQWTQQIKKVHETIRNKESPTTQHILEDEQDKVDQPESNMRKDKEREEKVVYSWMSPTSLKSRTLADEREKTLKKQKRMNYTNNTVNYDFTEEAPLQDQRITTYQIEVIMDTGATFSMLPENFQFAWTALVTLAGITRYYVIPQ